MCRKSMAKREKKINLGKYVPERSRDCLGSKEATIDFEQAFKSKYQTETERVKTEPKQEERTRETMTTRDRRRSQGAA